LLKTIREAIDADIPIGSNPPPGSFSGAALSEIRGR
jgi:hypothetical protein